MDPETKAKFQALENNGYLKGLREFAMARCAPFFWSYQQPNGSMKIRNGTICYARTGQRDIGITAGHVYQGKESYSEDLATHSDVEAQFGGCTIYPEKRLIAIDAALDLATFDVPEVFVSGSHKTLHCPKSWPPAPLKLGELVLYGGFPKSLKEPKGGEIVWPFQSFIWKVSDVTPTNIVMHVDFPNLLWPDHEDEAINEELGGISGGPVFRIVEQLAGSEKKVEFELVGIIYEFHKSLQVAMARPIGHIVSDGSLRSNSL